MIRVTTATPEAALAAPWETIAPFASNVFMHPAALKAASETMLTAITVLLAWDTAVEPNRLVGWWALQGRQLLLWSYLEALPYDYAFLSTPVIAPDRAGEVIPAFLAAIAADRRLPKTLRLRDLDGEGAARSGLDRAALPETVLIGEQRPMATRELGIKRSGSTRKKLRQDWNRLAATGTLETVNARDPGAIGAALEAFLEMEAAGWKGAGGTALLSNPRDATFARRFIAEMAALGQASVALLTLDGKPVAAQVLLYSGRTGFTWKTSYDPALARYSPGTLLVDRVCTELLDGEVVDVIDSSSIGEGFMATLFAGRKPITDSVLSVRPRPSPSYLAVASYLRLRQTIKTARQRRRGAKTVPASVRTP